MRCVIAGSYRRFLKEMLEYAKPVFENAGIEVVYPKNSDITNPDAPFPLMRYDNLTLDQAWKKINDYAQSHTNGYSGPTAVFGSLLEQRVEKRLPLNQELLISAAVELNFLETALRSDFVYVFNPGGYVGDSTKFELAYVIGSKIPVYALNRVAPRRERHLNAAVHMQQGKGKQIPVRDFLQWDITREVGWLRWFDSQIEGTGGFFSPEELVKHLYSTGRITQ